MRLRTRKSPHMAGFQNQVGGRCWSPAYKVYQDSHRTVLCSSASHGIRAGSQRGDLSNRVPFGTRPTFPCYPLAHQSASSPTTLRIAKSPKHWPDFLERFCSGGRVAGWKNTIASRILEEKRDADVTFVGCGTRIRKSRTSRNNR